MGWTQPVCEDRFRQMNPGREPYRIILDEAEWDQCCFCQRKTNIYVRIDPATVPFPMEDFDG